MRSSSSLRAFVTLALCGAGAFASVLSACSGGDDSPISPYGDGGGATGPGATVATRLSEATGVEWIVELDPTTRTAAFAFPVAPTPVVLAPEADPVAAASSFLMTYPEVFGVQRANDVQVEAAEVDDEGGRHVRFVQLAGGQPVADAVLQVHFDAEGTVTHVTGPFYPTLPAVAAAVPVVTPEAAAQRAVALVVAKLGEGTLAVAQPGHTEVRVLAHVPVLVHVVPVTVGRSTWEAWIDAADGAERRLESTGHEVSVTGAGMTTSRTIEIDAPKDGLYRLTRSGTAERSALTVIDNSTKGTLLYDGLGYSTRDASKWDREPIDETKQGVAVEVFYKLGLADRWFRSLGWKSFDGKGSPITVGLFDPDDTPVNAYFDSAGRPDFGFTAGTKFKKAAVSMDAVGHEFTHGVFHHATQIASQCSAETGAMNEGFGDIFGQLASADTVGGTPDDLGEEFGRTSTIRSLKDPAQRSGTNPNTNIGADHVENMRGQCHADAGIVDLAWYLMTFGGSHPEARRGEVKGGIGMASSKKLWWQLLRYELRGAASFQDLAKRSMIAAKSKSLSTEAVGCAWQAVGVLDAKTLKANYKVQCPVTDGGAPDTCPGKKDGFHCSELDKRAAYRCAAQSNTGVDYCAMGEHCTSAPGASSISCAKD